MKIEIKGSWHNRKLLIDGKDVTDNCESVQIDVRGTEPVRTTLVLVNAEVEAETTETFQGGKNAWLYAMFMDI